MRAFFADSPVVKLVAMDTKSVHGRRHHVQSPGTLYATKSADGAAAKLDTEINALN